MKFVVILFTLIQISVAMAAPKKLATPPTYTPNNPYGKWTALPSGKNYLFCGDRVIYGSSFEEKIKINYNGTDRLLSIREHCEMRRRELERAVASRVAEEPTLIQLQYEKLASYLTKVPGGIKAGRQYSLKEIRKAMKASEVNDLRAANLMLPVLTEPEFSKLYAGDTNNPQFTKTEHERYVSNLLTQNPAMLYTANGSLYYFSLNLSNDQLKLMAKVVGSGGGGGAESSGGSGGRSAGSKGNPETGSGGRRQMNDALEGTRQNPFEGSKMASQLNVRPQATVLPSSFGVDSNATFVPYDMKMPSVSFGPTRGVASSSRPARADRVQAVTVSSNPSLGMMNIGGMGRGANGGSSVGSGSRAGSGSGGRSNSAGSGSGPSTTTSKPATTQKATTTNLGAEDLVNPISQAAASRVMPKGVVSGDGPPVIALASGEFEGGLNFESPDYSCKSNQWEQMLYQTNKGNFSIKENNSDEKYACLPFTEKQFSSSFFCGVGTEGLQYSNSCVGGATDRNSCYDQIMIDAGNICRQYFEIEEPFNYDDILLCAERLFVITCDKIPCEVAPKIKKDANGNDIISELEVKDLNVDLFFNREQKVHPRTKEVTTVTVSSKTYAEVLSLPHLKREHLHQKVATGSKISLPSTNANWMVQIGSDQFTDHLKRMSLFYQAEMNTKCQFEKPKQYRFSGSQ